MSKTDFKKKCVYELAIRNRKQFYTNSMQARAEQLSACSDELYQVAARQLAFSTISFFFCFSLK